MSTHAPAGTPKAVLFDFGGVLTSSVLAGFAEFSQVTTGDPQLLLKVLGTDPEATRVLVEHEEGRLDDEGFEIVVAERLSAAGVPVDPTNLIARMQAHLSPDPAMVDLVAAVRTAGFAVGLVSNSLGRHCYAGFDLDAMFDAQAISGVEGVRKPSKRLYEIACQRLAVDLTEAVMVDDLEQNIVAAVRLGMGGVVHTDAPTTTTALSRLLDVDLDLCRSAVSGTQTHHSISSGHELEEAQ